MSDRPDHQAWLQWCHSHAPAVRGYLWGLLRRSAEADDLTQEVLCRAWQARDRYTEQGAARAYLLRIADRLVCDRHRRQGRETTVSEEAWQQCEPVATAEGPSAAMERSEATAQLEAALDELSPPQRRVLLLRYYGQMTFAEIAEQVGCPLSTALSHAYRGLAALRKRLVDCHE